MLVVRLWSGPNDMARKRFTTNRWLWLAVSLVLFVPPWFFFECETPGERLHPAVLWLVFFDPPLNLSAAIGGIVAFTLLFGIPAVAIGWVIQSLIIVLRDTVRPNTGAAAEHGASPNGGPAMRSGSSGVPGGPPSVS